MHISIDKNAGFCSGVKRTIKIAEEELAKAGSLYCLEQIIHNEEEEKRLQALGLKVINHDNLKKLNGAKVLIRAHGEPPETYQIAEKNNITLIEGTCPVVLKLQQKIKQSFVRGKEMKTQVVIYGMQNHPEVIGLNGQIENEAIIVESVGDIEKIDFERPVDLYAQTTKNKDVYEQIATEISRKQGEFQKTENLQFSGNNSICYQVSNRDTNLKEFARKNDLVLFVGGKKSSNGKYLFSVCKLENPKSYYIGGSEDIDYAWLKNITNIGITGATSTPEWLLRRVASKLVNDL